MRKEILVVGKGCALGVLAGQLEQSKVRQRDLIVDDVIDDPVSTLAATGGNVEPPRAGNGMGDSLSALGIRPQVIPL